MCVCPECEALQANNRATHAHTSCYGYYTAYICRCWTSQEAQVQLYFLALGSPSQSEFSDFSPNGHEVSHGGGGWDEEDPDRQLKVKDEKCMCMHVCTPVVALQIHKYFMHAYWWYDSCGHLTWCTHFWRIVITTEGMSSVWLRIFLNLHLHQWYIQKLGKTLLQIEKMHLCGSLYLWKEHIIILNTVWTELQLQCCRTAC